VKSVSRDEITEHKMWFRFCLKYLYEIFLIIKIMKRDITSIVGRLAQSV
jgi:hypothetical protein